MLTRLIVITLFIATACTPGPIQSSSQPQDIPAETADPAHATDSASTPSPEVDDGSQKKLIELARKDLAAQLSMDIGGIKVTSVETLTWPNAALGCPLPGKVYAQGTVPGFRIRLEAASKEYAYHTDRTGQFVLCATEDPDLENFPEIPVTPGDIDDGQPWVPVN